MNDKWMIYLNLYYIYFIKYIMYFYYIYFIFFKLNIILY